jgi:hypothetical protein
MYRLSNKFAVNVCGIALLVSGCGEHETPGSPTPRPPPQVSPSVTSLAIVGPLVVPSNSNVTYSANATMSNGVVTGNVRPTTWSVDNASVATINSAADGVGELAARQEGKVTIIATHQGQSSTLLVEVRDTSRQHGGAELTISYAPNPVPGSSSACPAFGLGTPTWTFTETIAETKGVGFTQETVTLNLYDDQERLIYTATEVERFRIDANAVFAEEFCTSLFGQLNGFYSDVFEGVDDSGNRLAFGGTRVRLLPVGTNVPASLQLSPVPLPPGAVIRSRLRRVR